MSYLVVNTIQDNFGYLNHTFPKKFFRCFPSIFMEDITFVQAWASMPVKNLKSLCVFKAYFCTRRSDFFSFSFMGNAQFILKYVSLAQGLTLSFCSWGTYTPSRNIILRILRTPYPIKIFSFLDTVFLPTDRLQNFLSPWCWDSCISVKTHTWETAKTTTSTTRQAIHSFVLWNNYNVAKFIQL